MTGSDVQRQIRVARTSRALFSVSAIISAALSVVHLASGALFPGVLYLIAAVLFVVSIVRATVRIRMRRKTLARTGASRPRMTPEDYRQLRAMGIENKPEGNEQR